MPQVERIIIFLENNKALTGYNAELLYVNSVYAFFVFIGALANFLIQVLNLLILEKMQSS